MHSDPEIYFTFTYKCEHGHTIQVVDGVDPGCEAHEDAS